MAGLEDRITPQIPDPTLNPTEDTTARQPPREDQPPPDDEPTFDGIIGFPRTMRRRRAMSRGSAGSGPGFEEGRIPAGRIETELDLRPDLRRDGEDGRTERFEVAPGFQEGLRLGGVPRTDPPGGRPDVPPPGGGGIEAPWVEPVGSPGDVGDLAFEVVPPERVTPPDADRRLSRIPDLTPTTPPRLTQLEVAGGAGDVGEDWGDDEFPERSVDFEDGSQVVEVVESVGQNVQHGHSPLPLRRDIDAGNHRIRLGPQGRGLDISTRPERTVPRRRRISSRPVYDFDPRRARSRNRPRRDGQQGF